MYVNFVQTLANFPSPSGRVWRWSRPLCVETSKICRNRSVAGNKQDCAKLSSLGSVLDFYRQVIDD